MVDDQLAQRLQQSSQLTLSNLQFDDSAPDNFSSELVMNRRALNKSTDFSSMRFSKPLGNLKLFQNSHGRRELNKSQINLASRDSFCSTQKSLAGLKSMVDVANRTNEGFRFKNSHAVERVSQALVENSYCDTSPSKLYQGFTPETIMNLRPRDKNKELGGAMRFKARSSIEKIID